MLTSSLFHAWLLLMFPLVYSPGPANIMFASNGARFGLKLSLPFMAGINVSFVLQSLLMGFGLGGLLLASPLLFTAVRYAGIAYILWLAFKFMRAAAGRAGERPHCLTFRDGLLLTCVNPKAWAMQAMMFSQFLHPAQALAPQVFTLSGWLCALNLTGHVVWILFGALLLSRAEGWLPPRARNLTYAGMLCGSVYCLV